MSKSEWQEWKQNMKSGAMGQVFYWTEVQSPLWAQLLFLIADYKTSMIYLS